MNIDAALNNRNLSTEQIEERVRELRGLDDSEEKRDRAFELAKWFIGVMSDIEPGVFRAAAGQMGLTRGEAAAFENVKQGHDSIAQAGLGVMAHASQSGEDIYKAVVAWRESPAGWRAIQTKQAAKPFLGDTAFSYYIDSTLDPKVRAELVARLEMYCKAGWADADLLGKPETPAAKRLLAVVERMQRKSKPAVSPGEASQAVAERFSELFIELKVVSSRVDEQSPIVFVAAKNNGPSGFDAADPSSPKGSVAGAGCVDIAIRVHGNEKQLMVASVTKGNPFGTQASSFLKHASAIQAGIRANLIAGVESVVEFSRYVEPAFYTDEDVANPINRHSVKGMGPELKSAGNLVVAMKDFECSVDHPLFTPELFLRAPINVFGASDPWSGALDQARSLAFGDSKGANRILAKAGLKASRDVMLHLSKMAHLTPQDDEIGVCAAKAATGLIQAFGDLPGLGDEIDAIADASTHLKASCREARGATFRILANGFLCDLSVEKAKLKAEDFRPTKLSVEKVHKDQEGLANKKRQALPNRIDPPGVSDARLMKAQFGRQVADLVEALPLSAPNIFPEGVAEKLSATFRRLAQVADGTMPSVDPASGRNEKTYQQSADFLRFVKNGSKDIGKVGLMVLDAYLPWVQLNQGDAFNPMKAEPPSVSLIEQMARDTAKFKKNPSKVPKPVGS